MSLSFRFNSEAKENLWFLASKKYFCSNHEGSLHFSILFPKNMQHAMQCIHTRGWTRANSQKTLQLLFCSLGSCSEVSPKNRYASKLIMILSKSIAILNKRESKLCRWKRIKKKATPRAKNYEITIEGFCISLLLLLSNF